MNRIRNQRALASSMCMCVWEVRRHLFDSHHRVFGCASERSLAHKNAYPSLHNPNVCFVLMLFFFVLWLICLSCTPISLWKKKGKCICSEHSRAKTTNIRTILTPKLFSCLFQHIFYFNVCFYVSIKSLNMFLFIFSQMVLVIVEIEKYVAGWKQRMYIVIKKKTLKKEN